MDRRETGYKALSMVREAEFQLVRAREKLDSARNWGIFDILGGGIISTLVKHGRMDDADTCIRQAVHLMERASALFPAIGEEYAPDTEGGFARFADIFFDGLLSDLYVQGRINDRRAAVERMIERVRHTERELTRICGA